MRLMIVHARCGYYATLMRYAARPAHGNAIRFTQPVGFHALLSGHRVVAIEDAVAVQQRRGRQHGDLATCGLYMRRSCFGHAVR